MAANTNVMIHNNYTSSVIALIGAGNNNAGPCVSKSAEINIFMGDAKAKSQHSAELDNGYQEIDNEITKKLNMEGIQGDKEVTNIR